MKVKHYLVTATILILMLCIGCTNKEPIEVNANDSSISTTPLLTLTDVTKAFSTNNMKLVPNKTDYLAFRNEDALLNAISASDLQEIQNGRTMGVKIGVKDISTSMKFGSETGTSCEFVQIIDGW